MRRRRRLAEFREMAPRLNNGAGEAVTELAIQAADRLLSRRPYVSSAFRLYPTINGGVIIESQTGAWDYSLACLPNCQVEMYGVEVDGEAEMDPRRFLTLDETFITEFDQRVKVRG